MSASTPRRPAVNIDGTELARRFYLEEMIPCQCEPPEVAQRASPR